MSIHRTFALLFALTLSAGLLNGCALSSVRECREIAQQMREDQVRFYEYLAESYYLMGYEYFELSLDLKERNNASRSQQMARRAKEYQEMSRTLYTDADLLRRNYAMSERDAPDNAGDESATMQMPSMDIKP